MAAFEVVKKKKEPMGMPPTNGTPHEVEFTFYAPAAKKVFITGKFNAWNTNSTLMKKGKDGTWKIKLALLPGRHEYKFFVDGAWASDQACAELVPNPFGTNNCVLTVH